MRLALCLLYIAVLGILSHFIGEALPRRWFCPDKAPFAPWKWEKGGRAYHQIRVHAWKDRLPDMSKISPDMVKKSISLTDGSAAVARVAVETCVAETVHWALMLFSPGIYWIWSNGTGVLLSFIYAVSHLPFIIIQRYNRPTLCALAGRLKQREERIQKCKS